MIARTLFAAAAVLGAFAHHTPGLAQTMTQPVTLDGARAYLFQSCPIAKALALPVPLSPMDILENDGTAFTPESAVGLASVAGALVEPLISLAGDMVAAWLDQRAKEQVSTTAAVATGLLATGSVGSRSLPCLVLVQGKFGVLGNRPKPGDLQLAAGERPLGWDWPAPWLALFGLTEKPRVYLELKLVASPAHDAVRLAPLFLDLRRTAAERGRGKPVHLALTASLSLRGTALGSAVVPLPSPVAEATRLTPAHLAGSSSAWIALPRPLRKDTGAIDHEHLINGPVSIQLALVESVQPQPVDQLVARMFGATRRPLAEHAAAALRRGIEPDGGAGERDADPTKPK
ncbi:hypothetical protein STVA_35180 [Allostella vacuolata]|nr:hypothetical protein STVA_35180 [Stella vacuolata]